MFVFFILGDEIVAATIHLDHLNKDDVLKLLKIIEPYDENMKVLTKQNLKASVSLGSLNGDLEGFGGVSFSAYISKSLNHIFKILVYMCFITVCIFLYE